MIEGQEDVTWEDWVALADACERSGVEALFRSDHYVSVAGEGERGVARRLGDDQRARRPDHGAAAGHDGLADELPPPVDPRQARDHRRPRQRRPDRARHGHRLVGDRAHRLRLPLPEHEGADGRARGAARDRPRRPLGRRPVLLQGQLLRAQRPQGAPVAGPAPAPAADHGRRRRPARRPPGRALRRRVRHGHADARGDRRAQGEHRPRLREGGPRPDPVQRDDRLRDRRPTPPSTTSACAR